MNIRAHRRSCNGVGKRAAVPLLAASIAAAALLFAVAPAHAQTDDPTASASMLENVSPPAGGGWDRIDEAPPNEAPPDPADISSDDGQVLELPQVTDPAAATDAQADNAGDANAGATQDAGQQADGSDTGGDSADAPDQVGSIDDYQSQQDGIGAGGVYLMPMAMRPLGMNPPFGLNPPMSPMMQPPYVPRVGMPPGGMLPPGPVIVQPGVRGYFPPTSPMMMQPRPLVSMPGGWWTRARR
jgi:hypothetical protein